MVDGPLPRGIPFEIVNYLLAVRRIVAEFRAPDATEQFEPNCDVTLDAALLWAAFARDTVERKRGPADPAPPPT